MKTYYHIQAKNFYSGAFEIKPNRPYEDVESLLFPFSKKKLPEDIFFTIKKGKRAVDMIYYFEDVSKKFYSYEFIKILSRHIPMKDYCYQINLKDSDKKYYTLYNLPSVKWINRTAILNYVNEPYLFYVEKDIPSIFLLEDSANIIVSEDVKKSIEDNKLTNICFEECFLFSREEYDAYMKHWENIGKYMI